MTTGSWFLLIGAVLLFMALVAGRLRHLPLSTGIVYLGVGVVLGPTVAGQFHFNPVAGAGMLELLAEVAVLISLFAAGLKLSAPLGHPVWFTPLRLATLSMVATVFLVALAAMLLLDIPFGAAVLLGAVLAHDIQVSGPSDVDHVRFALTAEAGINDGVAFPMVMLGLGLMGLHELGEGLHRWLLVDVLWACGAGVAVGAVLGSATAWLTQRMARYGIQSELTEDFLGLGLISFSYGGALLLGSYGFLAVFAAGYMLRRTESKLGSLIDPPGRMLALDPIETGQQDPAYMSAVSLTLVEQFERLAEVALLVLVGGMLFVNSWQIEYVLLALVLFFVVRPLGVLLGLAGRWQPAVASATLSWFGVRGIGTLYYMAYAVNHGMDEEIAARLFSAALIVVTLSVVLHGVTVAPLMRLYRRYRGEPV
jgi:NhaP-type Na+/H+ or K+/H+ antiporter